MVRIGFSCTDSYIDTHCNVKQKKILFVYIFTKSQFDVHSTQTAQTLVTY